MHGDSHLVEGDHCNFHGFRSGMPVARPSAMEVAMRPLPALVIAAAVCACSSPSPGSGTPPLGSNAVTTAEMWPSMSAQSYADTVNVFAAVLKGSTFITLDDGEFFTVTLSGGQEIVL